MMTKIERAQRAQQRLARLVEAFPERFRIIDNAIVVVGDISNQLEEAAKDDQWFAGALAVGISQQGIIDTLEVEMIEGELAPADTRPQSADNFQKPRPQFTIQ